jgi:hypothetical protein
VKKYSLFFWICCSNYGFHYVLKRFTWSLDLLYNFGDSLLRQKNVYVIISIVFVNFIPFVLNQSSTTITSKYTEKTSTLELETEHLFWNCGVFPAVSSPKQTTLVLSVFFYKHEFSRYRKHLHPDSNSHWYYLHSYTSITFQGTTNIFTRTQDSFQVLNTCFCNLRVEINNFSWRRPCIVLNFRATKATVTVTRTQVCVHTISPSKKATMVLTPFFCCA